jgi:hypothetical protein
MDSNHPPTDYESRIRVSAVSTCLHFLQLSATGCAKSSTLSARAQRGGYLSLPAAVSLVPLEFRIVIQAVICGVPARSPEEEHRENGVALATPRQTHFESVSQPVPKFVAPTVVRDIQRFGRIQLHSARRKGSSSP